MKSTKTLFLSLLIVSLFSSFAVKPAATNSNSALCGPWVSICNYGSVNIEIFDVEMPPDYFTVNDLAPSNCEYSGVMGGAYQPLLEVRVKLAAGQNGYITVYEGSTQVYSEATNTSTLIYRFDIPVTGCKQYNFVIN